MKAKKTDYDKALAQLEKLVEKIQRGELGLEEMRGEVKTGLALIAQCKAKLREIEKDLDSVLEEEE